MPETTCQDCGTAITGKGKTGLCRACHLKKVRTRSKVSAPSLPNPAVETPIPVPGRAKTIVEEAFGEGSIQAKDRPIGDAPRNDPTVVLGKDPNYHYRWVLEDADHITRARRKGYVPVKSGEVQAPDYDHGRPDGFVGHRGLVLTKALRGGVEERQARLRGRGKVAAREALEESLEGSLRAGKLTEAEAKRIRGQFVERTGGRME